MKNKRLATISLIIMALVSTPRAMQQLRHSIDAAQQRAGLVWWNLLLTPNAQAAAADDSHALKPCPQQQLIAGRSNLTFNLPPARSSNRPATAQSSLAARTAQRQTAESLPVNTELAADHYRTDSAMKSYASRQALAAAQQQRELHRLAFEASPEVRSALTSPEVQRALASLNEHNLPAAPTDAHVASDVEASELTTSPHMNALMTILTKKGLNVQFIMKKARDLNQLPRPRGRTLISHNFNTLPLPSVCPQAQPLG